MLFQRNRGQQQHGARERLVPLAKLLLYTRLKPGEAAGFSGFYFARRSFALRNYTLTRPPATGPAFTYAIAFIFGFAFTLLAVHPKKPTSQAAEDRYPETSMQ